MDVLTPRAGCLDTDWALGEIRRLGGAVINCNRGINLFLFALLNTCRTYQGVLDAQARD